jgi:hypothetical protein
MLRTLRSHLLIGFFAVILSAANASAYTLRGELTINAVGSEENYHQVYNIPGLTSLEDDVWVTGWSDPKNAANGAFKVDLAEGSVGTYAFADNGHDVSYSNAASAQASASLQETLFFMIPSGTFHSDMYVYLHGTLEGDMTIYHTDNLTDPVPVVQHSWQFSLSGALGRDSYDSGGTTLDGVNFLDESFTLKVLLVAAGEYASERIVTMNVLASMMSTAAVQNHRVDNDHVECDFLNTGQFTSLEVPDGVTWTSSSGVFLTASTTPVPEPGTILLLLGGLAGLAGFLRLRRTR